jgi:hypothetical protein
VSELIDAVLDEYDVIAGRALSGGPSAMPSDFSPPGGAFVVGFLDGMPFAPWITTWMTRTVSAGERWTPRSAGTASAAGTATTSSTRWSGFRSRSDCCLREIR